MTAKIIAFRAEPDKARGPISVHLVLESARTPISGELSNLEREVIKYAIADQVALALKRDGKISSGHKTAIYAHLVSLLHRDGEAETLQFVATLAGMIGCSLEPDAEPMVDNTDWSSVTLS